MKITTLSILTGIALVAALPGQNTVVVPAVAGLADGNDSRSFPFGRTQFRMQQLIEASAISATAGQITAIAFRPDNGNSSGSQAATFPNVTIEMIHTSLLPSQLLPTYSANISGTPTQVFNGPLTLGAYASGPLGIAPFDIIPLSTPFPFDPAQGNLLIDITATDPAGATSTNWFPDTARTGGTWELYGMPGTFSASQLAWPRMTVNSNSPSGQGNRAGIGVGGSFDIFISSGGPFGGGFSYSGSLLAGVRQLASPIDLAAFGAPGNLVHVDSFINIPFQLKQGVIGGPRWNLTIAVPNDPTLFGLPLHCQPLYVDAPANALGIVAGEAMRVTLGESFSHPTNQVSGTDLVTGTAVFTSGILGAAVIQLIVL